MTLGPVTKIDKRKKTNSKKFDDDIMSEICDVIVVFPIYGQFEAFQKPDSRCTVCKTYTFKETFYLTKTENKTKKCRRQLSHYCFE